MEKARAGRGNSTSQSMTLARLLYPPPHGVALARCRLTDRPLRPCRRQTLIGSATRYCESVYRRPRARTPLQGNASGITVRRVGSKSLPMKRSGTRNNRKNSVRAKSAARTGVSRRRFLGSVVAGVGASSLLQSKFGIASSVLEAPIPQTPQNPDRHGRFSNWDRQAGPDRERLSVRRALHAPCSDSRRSFRVLVAP